MNIYRPDHLLTDVHDEVYAFIPALHKIYSHKEQETCLHILPVLSK